MGSSSCDEISVTWCYKVLEVKNSAWFSTCFIWSKHLTDCIFSPPFTGSCCVEALRRNKIKFGFKGGANTCLGVWPRTWSARWPAALWACSLCWLYFNEAAVNLCFFQLWRRRPSKLSAASLVEICSFPFAMSLGFLSPQNFDPVRSRSATSGFYAAHIEHCLFLHLHTLKPHLIMKCRLDVRPGNKRH